MDESQTISAGASLIGIADKDGVGAVGAGLNIQPRRQ